MKKFAVDDVIYALATAWGQAAIAVIRVSGNGCIEEVAKSFVCHGKLTDYETNSAIFGHLTDARTHQKLDDCIITVFKDGHGYTGEESLEISCHGGLQTVKSILEYLQSLGFRAAEGGEFTFRAFINSKMDLTQAEAVNELVNSRGKAAQLLALNRLSGTLYRRIEEIKNIVLEALGKIEVQLDYAEDELDENLEFPSDNLLRAKQMLGELLATYQTGKLYSQGAKIVLAGAANAGKSSLFNLFLKQERAIVSDTKGTTRDFIEAQCSVGDIPILLYDTAGLRESSDEIEREGVRRSRDLLEVADLIIYLIDATEPVIDEKIVGMKNCISVVNKIDVYNQHVHAEANFPHDFLELSVLTGAGFEHLCEKIVTRLTDGLQTLDDSCAVIENARQKENLERAQTALVDACAHYDANLPLDIVTMDIQDTLEALGELIGEVTTDDILDRIFSDFCVGK